MAMLNVQGVEFFYGRRHVLWDVSLRVDQGDIVALVGSNASGKSTLIRSISGLAHVSSGTIEFDGQRIDRTPAHEIVEMGLCQIPEGRMLFGDMSVEENLEMGAYTKKTWRERKKAIDEIYELFPILKEKRNKAGRSLSGGQQQMLAVARGLMSKPKLLMLDEPSIGLAPQVVAEIFDICTKLREHGITIFLVEQNVQRTLEVADRAYVIENGRIVLQGSGKELLGNDGVREAYLGL
jgi:branched-chain amino acid transport system ATP-binding protein